MKVVKFENEKYAIERIGFFGKNFIYKEYLDLTDFDLNEYGKSKFYFRTTDSYNFERCLCTKDEIPYFLETYFNDKKKPRIKIVERYSIKEFLKE